MTIAPALLNNPMPSLPPMGQGRKPSKVYTDLAIPPEVQSRWTSTLNLVFEIVHVPTVVVTRLHNECLEIVSANDADTNPYKQAMAADLNTGMCCEAVMYGERVLWVPNAQTKVGDEAKAHVGVGGPLRVGQRVGDPKDTLAVHDSLAAHPGVEVGGHGLHNECLEIVSANDADTNPYKQAM
ncbi:MAG: hypothetical protein AAFS10_09665, partial [Myxococcota bacterium]